MVTGVGMCRDAIDAQGQPLPESEADPLTVDFIESVLDVEKPDLVILTGDQLHHDILDSRSTLFKVCAPLIERSIPFAAVFGDHDSEGAHALPRKSASSYPSYSTRASRLRNPIDITHAKPILITLRLNKLHNYSR